jgi:hypothetical protein
MARRRPQLGLRWQASEASSQVNVLVVGLYRRCAWFHVPGLASALLAAVLAVLLDRAFAARRRTTANA